ncbi:hypothetical protein Tco_1414200 [Tanacetum coccineum]
MTPYTAYPDIQGIIYQDDMDINCLMRIEELHKFSDGTLNYGHTALNDIATEIQMEVKFGRERGKKYSNIDPFFIILMLTRVMGLGFDLGQVMDK